jgi:hypothetical protein
MAGVAACPASPSDDETPHSVAMVPAPEAAGASAPEHARAADGCDAIDLPEPAGEKGVQLSIELPLEAGQERQVCKLVKLDRAVNLNWYEGLYTPGSHHGLIARTSYHGELPTQNIAGETVADPGATIDCEGGDQLWETHGTIAFGRATNADPKVTAVKGTFPDDVAVKLQAGDVLLVNFHMINTTSHAVRACYKQNLYSIPDEQLKHEAGTMFYYNPFIAIPANAHATATMACPITDDVSLVAQVSHMHKRGYGYKASLLDGDPLQGGKEIELLYEGTEWDEPLVHFNNPALSLHAGQWLQWTCEYNNPDSRNVSQGQQTTDEMCVFIGQYWPHSIRMDECLVDNDLGAPSARRVLGTGAMNALQMLQCLEASPQKFDGGGPDTDAARYQSQACIAQSCANASGRFDEIAAGMLDPASISCD